MGENVQSLDSLLVNIRSVVQSSKGGVLLSQLQDDYRKLIGTGIPFEMLGYNSLETFLQSAPKFVSIKKDTCGQLFAEAVADSSTAHLASLISNQKRGKSKKELKPRGYRKNWRSCRSDVASVKSNSSIAGEKDKEIEELKSKLEREKSMNEELSFEVSRLQTELKNVNKALGSPATRQNYQQSDQKVQDLTIRLEKEIRTNEGFCSEIAHLRSQLKKSENSLRTEKETVQKLNEQLKSLQVPIDDEKDKKYEEMCTLLKEVEDLKSKLEKEKKVTRDSSSQIIRLNSLVKINRDFLSAEQETVKKLKCQIEALQSSSGKESYPVFEYLGSSATNSKEKCKSLQNISSNFSWEGQINLLETDAAKQLNSYNNLSPTSDQNPMLAALKSCEEQMTDQIEKFVIQIKKQNQKLMMLEKTQHKHFQRLDEKIKNVSDSLSIENIIQEILKRPQFLKYGLSESGSFCASDNIYQSMPSITPISSQSDNDSERSFKAGPFARGRYGPPPTEAYGTKKSFYR